METTKANYSTVKKVVEVEVKKLESITITLTPDEAAALFIISGNFIDRGSFRDATNGIFAKLRSVFCHFKNSHKFTKEPIPLSKYFYNVEDIFNKIDAEFKVGLENPLS